MPSRWNLQKTKNLTSQATEQARVTRHSPCPASSIAIFFFFLGDLHYEWVSIIWTYINTAHKIKLLPS